MLHDPTANVNGNSYAGTVKLRVFPDLRPIVIEGEIIAEHHDLFHPFGPNSSFNNLVCASE